MPGLLIAAACLPAQAQWKADSTEKIETSSPLVTAARMRLTAGEREATLHVVFFNVKRCSLRVVDNADPHGRLDAAMRAGGCIAGVNASFFHPDRSPLGLVISDGKELHARETAALLSGMIVVKGDGFSILRVAEFKPDKTITQALQAGPFLVDGGTVVAGLDAGRMALRTAVATDGKGNGALISCSGVSLAEMGEILATPGIFPGLHVERALNLDGGSSTGFWLDAKPEALYLPEWRDVRNYLAIVPRGK